MIATWLTPDDLARARELAGKYRTHSQTIFTAVIQAALDDEKLLKRLLES